MSDGPEPEQEPQPARGAAAPKDYSLIVPDGWFKIRVDEPELRDRGIMALAERQFRGNDSAPKFKEQLMRELQRQAKQAFAAGGIELYLSTVTAGPVPLASSLLVSVLPPDEGPGDVTPSRLAQQLAAAGKDASVVRLPEVGRAVREERVEEAKPDEQLGNTLGTSTVLYYVPIPASGVWLGMTFSTPMEPLATDMVELFDVIAQTLRWS